MARAQRLVAVVLRAELAAILRPQMAGMGAQAMRSRRVTHRPAQMTLQARVHLMGDGLGLAHALQLAVAVLSTEFAAILRLQMAGRIVKAKQLRRATRKLVQTALLETVHSTVDGPVSGCVQKIAAAELRGKLAVTPRPRMAGGLA